MVKGNKPFVVAVLALVSLVLAAPAKAGVQTGEDKELARLIDSSTTPLPIAPIAVPQVWTLRQVEEMLAAGNIPTLFQISWPTRPYDDPVKVRFFQMLSIEYALKVNFRKVSADSDAARRLYNRAVTKPVYLLCDPAESGKARCAFIDESEMPEGRDVTQTVIENFIYKRLGIVPTLLTTFALTPANMESLVFQYQPDLPNPGATAKWIAVFFFPGGTKVPGPINRVRALIALERFFYSNRLRIAECDLSASGEVYRRLVHNDTKGAIPKEPELWLVNPTTHHAVKYTSEGGSPPIADLTHSAFELWLAVNGVARPPDSALDAQAAFGELAELERQTKEKKK